MVCLDGEDNSMPKRIKSQIEENRFWIDRQREEKKMKDEMDKKEDLLYGKQDIYSMNLLVFIFF